MRLLSLTLTNFKGARSLTIEPNGNDLSIYGDNAAGKTTIADAWFWLLFDKDSQNRATSNFEIKTLGPDKKPIPGIDHTVSAVLEIVRGSRTERLTLTKTYKEQWVKKRGSAQQEFSGHTTDYFINSVPVQKKEYDDRIASICSERVFRMLTDPTYFNAQIEWTDRRKLLLGVCGGDVTTDAVIASNPKLAGLREILGDHSIEDYRKILAGRRKEINEELEQIPVRIQEVNRSRPVQAAPIDETVIQKLRSDLQSLREKKAEIAAGGLVAEKVKRIREIEAEMLRVSNEISRKNAEAQESAGAHARKHRQELAEANAKVQNLQAQIRSLQTTVEHLDSRMTSLRAQYAEEQAKRFLPTGIADSCAACGQALPAEKVEAARAMAEEDFNTRKAETLGRINSEGKALSQQKEEASQKVADLENQLTQEQALVTELGAQTQAAPTVALADVGSSEEYQRFAAEKQAVEKEIGELRIGTANASAEVDQQISAIEAKLAEVDQAAAVARQITQCDERIKQLSERERELAGIFEGLERELFLTEEFIRTQVSLLESRINSHFEIAQFKLFSEQVNGGLKECCEIMAPNELGIYVPYGSLNHGMRVNVGLDVINTLAKEQGFAPPIFIDNAESVTRLLPTSGQQIRLVVSAPDKALRFEISEPTEAQEALLIA